MKKWLKVILFGIGIWAIPFIVAMFFYSPEGTLKIDLIFFKTVMLLVGALTGAYFIILYFKNLEKKFFKEGILLGGSWFVIQWALDFIILIPMTKMHIPTYIVSIGLRYGVILIMTVTVGFVLEKSLSK